MELSDFFKNISSEEAFEKFDKLASSESFSAIVSGMGDETDVENIRQLMLASHIPTSLCQDDQSVRKAAKMIATKIVSVELL